MTEWSKIRRGYEIALIGVILYVALDAVAQLLPPHYSPISQAESDLAVGMFSYIMTLNFLNRGVLSVFFITALIGTIRLQGGSFSQYRGGFYLLGVWSIGALLLAAFPTDVPSTPVSWHGAIHLVVAIIAFLAGGFGTLMISLRMTGDRLTQGVRRFALPIGVLTVILCLLELLEPFIAPHFASNFGGLVERVFLGTVLLWMSSISVHMLRYRDVPAGQV
jgi:hypothetical protein